MTQYLFSRRTRAFGLSGVLAVLCSGFVATPAFAGTPGPPTPLRSAGVTSVDTSACTDPTLGQPFASARDNNWYTLVPGQSPGSFNGNGWTLSGGARVVPTTLGNGQTGSVLDLPSGSSAVSPSICVSSAFPTARTLVRNVVGGEGVQFYVSYEGTNTWQNPKNTGQFHGQQTSWTLSDPINLQPSSQSGWQIVRFAFVPGGKNSDFQLYDFYVDPRMKS
jgi:hypothetical protein